MVLHLLCYYIAVARLRAPFFVARVGKLESAAVPQQADFHISRAFALRRGSMPPVQSL